MTAKEKKQQLINFMKWKMSNSGETEEEQQAILRKCEKMSYKALHNYAIMNDFIDY